MNCRDAAKKVQMGHEYTTDDGTTYTNLNGAFWTVVNEAGQVRTENGRVYSWTSRWAAQAHAKAHYGCTGDVQFPRRSAFSVFGR